MIPEPVRSDTWENGARNRNHVRAIQVTDEWVQGEVVGSDGETIYVAQIGRDGDWSCGCLRAASGNPCYHLVALFIATAPQRIFSFLVRPRRPIHAP